MMIWLRPVSGFMFMNINWSKYVKPQIFYFHRHNVKLLKLKIVLPEDQRQLKFEIQSWFYRSILSATAKSLSRKLSVAGDLCLLLQD